jgi:hypothetical protein
MIVPDTSCSTEQGTLSAVNGETGTADSGRPTEYSREHRVNCRKDRMHETVGEEPR